MLELLNLFASEGQTKDISWILCLLIVFMFDLGIFVGFIDLIRLQGSRFTKPAKSFGVSRFIVEASVSQGGDKVCGEREKVEKPLTRSEFKAVDSLSSHAIKYEEPAAWPGRIYKVQSTIQ